MVNRFMAAVCGFVVCDAAAHGRVLLGLLAVALTLVVVRSGVFSE